MIHWIGLFFSIFLAYPLCTLPTLIRSKQNRDVFFSNLPFVISKTVGNGMGINTKTFYGFFVLLIIGSAILFLSVTVIS